VRARGIEARIRKWGEDAFRTLFDSREGGKVYDRLVEAGRRGEPCLLTLGTTDPDVLGQPWELLRDQRGPLAMRGVTIRLPRPSQAHPGGPQPRVAPAAAGAADR